LPIGIQTFRNLREECYYADKTGHIEELIEQGTHYFLSRPRRFGKSLLLDTIKELFEGSEALFRGLHIHGRWDFTKRHPVVRLDFGGGGYTTEGAVKVRAAEMLDLVADAHGISLGELSPEGRFEFLLHKLHETTGERVVVLVDEYDKPILDAIEQPETARANRDFLRGLYGVIKSCDAHVRFAMLTGGETKGVRSLRKCLRENDFAGVEQEFRAIYAGIPADWHRKNNIGHFEGYYASVFYASLAALGLDLRVEDASASGRLDLALPCDGRIHLFEFKVVERAGEGTALKPLRERGYADKYRSSGEPIHLIGVEFSEQTRNISAFDIAEA